MAIKQISVFVENKQGKLHKMTSVMGAGGVDLIAMSIADTTDFGIMRCIVTDPDNALKVLKEGGFTASSTYVLAVEVPDKPGGLAGVLEVLSNAGIDVEYLYSFVRTKSDSALIMFKVDDNEKAVETLKANGITMLTDEEVYSLKAK